MDREQSCEQLKTNDGVGSIGGLQWRWAGHCVDGQHSKGVVWTHPIFYIKNREALET